MRSVALIVLMAVCAACASDGGGASPSSAPSAFADRLDELGFFRFAAAREREALRQRVRRDGVDAIFDVDKARFFPADAEDLAEGGVDAVLHDLSPALVRERVRIGRIEEDFTIGGAYHVRLDGRRWTLYSAAELERSDTSIWGLAAARTTALLNRLLADAGSEERVYGLYGGNDFVLVLLTPALRRVIAAQLPASTDRPYVPTEQPPWFGQAHG